MERIVRPVRAFVRFAPRFDGVDSLINFGLCPEQWFGPQSIVALILPTATGEVSTGTIFSITPSGANTGPRFYVAHSGGNPTLTFNAHSSGSSGFPQRSGDTNSIIYNNWYFVAATWDGTINFSGIRLFYARDFNSLTEGYSTGVGADGSGTPGFGENNNFILGNRGDQARTFTGSIAYVVRYRGVLDPEELSQARRQGPLADRLRDRVTLAYANGIDYGPYNRKPIRSIAITYREGIDVRGRMGITARSFYIPEPGAAATFNAAWANAANAVLSSGARAA